MIRLAAREFAASVHKLDLAVRQSERLRKQVAAECSSIIADSVDKLLGTMRVLTEAQRES